MIFGLLGLFFVLNLWAFSSVEYGEYGRDDLDFLGFIEDSGSVVEFLDSRSSGWSSRVVAEFLIYYIMPNQGIFVLLATLNALTLPLLMIRLGLGKHFWEVSFWQLIASIVLLGIIPLAITIPSTYWITGFFNYTLAGNVFFLAIIPISDLLLRRQTSILFRVIGIIAGALIFFINEQFGFTALLIMILSLGYLFLSSRLNRDQKLDSKLDWPRLDLLISLGSLVITLILVLNVPGNQVRLAAEIKRYYPDFNEVGILSRIATVSRHLLVNYFYFNWISWLVPSSLALTLLATRKKLGQLNFRKELGKYFFNRDMAFLVILALGALGSLALLIMSPTYAASGTRVYFLASLIAVVISIRIFSEFKRSEQIYFLPLIFLLGVTLLRDLAIIID